jgi:hypothetical protein
MKKIILVLLLIVAVESWGIYGAARANHVYHTCTLEIGPLCYAWEDNALGKLLGKERSQDIEDQLIKARKIWEHDFVEKVLEAKKSGANVSKALDDAADAAKKGLDELGDKLKDLKDVAK